MPNSSLKARIARLGPVQGVARVSSGSPRSLALTPLADRAALKTVSAAIELARRGIPLLKAKRVLEDMIERGRSYVRLPAVEEGQALIQALRHCGIAAAEVAPPEAVDVKAVRERLGMTQEQFALRFRIDPDALRNWESRRRAPDAAARCMLHMIARDPDRVEDMLSS